MIDLSGQSARRDSWYARTRAAAFFNVDGSGQGVAFEAPYREPVWVLPAFYNGEAHDITLANRIVERYGQHSQEFGIFQSNAFALNLSQFDALLTPAARDLMVWHTERVFLTYGGAAQVDFKFHGANDNMPMMATMGLILGGEKLENPAAARHGLWNLHQFRRLLSRAAWASEFNSSTYSAVTLSAVAKLANLSRNEEVRDLARDIEARLWAEVLLHYHPGSLQQAGPQCRAYAIDSAGHNHALQLLFWLLFGARASGRDLEASYFKTPGDEVLHFGGNPGQSIAEYCDLLVPEFVMPPALAALFTKRNYPALLRGRSECMARYDGAAGEYHTQTWMQPDFSLGTVNGPLMGGEQTSSLHLTYRRSPTVASFRDGATAFVKYLTQDVQFGAHENAEGGGFSGEAFVANQGWLYALQEKNVALLLCTPNLKNAPLLSDTLKLALVFPAHFGQLTRSICGEGPAVAGHFPPCVEVAPVSVEAGEVYIHVQPLLPTGLERRAAVRLVRQNDYEVLEFVNYEGEKRSWTREALALVCNGLVVTVVPKREHASLEDFHQAMSAATITDYFFAGHRFLQFDRADIQFEVTLTTNPPGVQQESIDGRPVPRPLFESNQLDVAQLPFVSGTVARNAPCFPWGDSLEALPYVDLPWLIGSRGLPTEPNYSCTRQALKASAALTT